MVVRGFPANLASDTRLAGIESGEGSGEGHVCVCACVCVVSQKLTDHATNHHTTPRHTTPRFESWEHQMIPAHAHALHNPSTHYVRVIVGRKRITERPGRLATTRYTVVRGFIPKAVRYSSRSAAVGCSGRIKPTPAQTSNTSHTIHCTLYTIPPSMPRWVPTYTPTHSLTH